MLMLGFCDCRSTCDVEKITMLKDEQLEKSVLAKIRCHLFLFILVRFKIGEPGNDLSGYFLVLSLVSQYKFFYFTLAPLFICSAYARKKTSKECLC